MCFKSHLLHCLLLLAVYSPLMQADEVVAELSVELSVTPQTCVSLQQGRTCYSKITAQWRSGQPLDLCLALGTQILRCWTQQQQAEHQFEFAASSSGQVVLLHRQQPVAQATIAVNWVHKASKTKRHWRLF